MDKIGFFVKFAIVIAVLSVVCLFIVQPLSLEFYITLAALGACIVVIVVGAVIMYKRNKKDK